MFKRFFEKIKNGFKKVGNALISGPRRFFRWTGNKLRSVWQGTKNIFRRAWQGTKNIVGKAWNGIKRGTSNLWRKTKNMFSRKGSSDSTISAASYSAGGAHVVSHVSQSTNDVKDSVDSYSSKSIEDNSTNTYTTKPDLSQYIKKTEDMEKEDEKKEVNEIEEKREEEKKIQLTSDNVAYEIEEPEVEDNNDMEDKDIEETENDDELPEQNGNEDDENDEDIEDVEDSDIIEGSFTDIDEEKYSIILSPDKLSLVHKETGKVAFSKNGEFTNTEGLMEHLKQYDNSVIIDGGHESGISPQFLRYIYDYVNSQK